MLRGRREARRISPPEWEGSRSATRVLIEHADGAVGTVLAERLGRLGHDVLVCSGPTFGVGCPLLREQSCPAVDGADIVVTGLVTDVRGRFITSRIWQHRPDVPMIAEATDWMAQGSDVLREVHRVYPVCSTELLDLVDSLSS